MRSIVKSIVAILTIVSMFLISSCGKPYPEPDNKESIKLLKQYLINYYATSILRLVKTEICESNKCKIWWRSQSERFGLTIGELPYKYLSEETVSGILNTQLKYCIEGFKNPKLFEGTENGYQTCFKKVCDEMFSISSGNVNEIKKKWKELYNKIMNLDNMKLDSFETLYADEKTRTAIYKSNWEYNWHGKTIQGYIKYKLVKTSDGKVSTYVIEKEITKYK